MKKTQIDLDVFVPFPHFWWHSQDWEWHHFCYGNLSPPVFVAHIVDGRNCTGLPHVLQRLDEASKKMYQSCICQVWWVGGGVLKASCYLQILSLIVHDSTDSTLLSHFIHFSTAFLGHDDSGINIKLDTCLTNFKDNAIIVSGAPEDKSKFVLVTEINLQVSCKIVRLP